MNKVEMKLDKKKCLGMGEIKDKKNDLVSDLKSLQDKSYIYYDDFCMATMTELYLTKCLKSRF